VLQCVAICYSMVPFVGMFCNRWLVTEEAKGSLLQCVAVCCSALRCAAVCCNVVQYVTVCYRVL